LQQAATKRVVDICRETDTRVHALGQASAQMFAVSQAHSGDSSAVSRMTLIRSLQVYDYSRRQMINGKIGDKEDWRNNARLYQSYGLNARAFISGAIIKEKEQRLIGYTAGLLSTALLANHLQRNNKQPIMYSSLGNGEILISGKEAGIDWRTNNLHPQLQRARIACDA
jgi:hypothetical protein